MLFIKHLNQLSDLDGFIELRDPLLSGKLGGSFIVRGTELYCTSISARSPTLQRCIGFIDFTVIRVTRPGGHNLKERLIYNEHNRAHVLKFQALRAPSGIILHGFGPAEGRFYDMTLYWRRKFEKGLQDSTPVCGVQYHVYRDPDYAGKPWIKYQSKVLH